MKLISVFRARMQPTRAERIASQTLNWMLVLFGITTGAGIIINIFVVAGLLESGDPVLPWFASIAALVVFCTVLAWTLPLPDFDKRAKQAWRDEVKRSTTEELLDTLNVATHGALSDFERAIVQAEITRRRGSESAPTSCKTSGQH